MLTMEGLSCGYRGTPVIEGVSAQVAAGDVLCLLGPNGAGKTTLFKSVLGLIPLLSGRVRVDGQDLHTLSPAARARIIGYVPQASQNPFAFTVMDVVLMGRTAYLGRFAAPGARDRALAHEALVRLGVDDLAGRPFSQLSGGQRQMVLIARAIAQQARIVMLDEPTSALDFGNQVKVLEQIVALRLAGIAIVLTTHAPEHAFLLGSQVLLLRDGGVFAAGPATEVLTAATLGQTYGVPVHVGHLRIGDRDLTTCHPLIGAARAGQQFRKEDPVTTEGKP